MNVLVLSDNKPLLDRARPTFERRKVNRWTFSSSSYIHPKLDYKHIIKTYDLVISMHCKTIFPKELFAQVRCINIHPGYNPFNRGLFSHIWSMLNGLPAGVTIHEMVGEIDGGPVICQSQVEIRKDDTSESLYERILDEELLLIHERIDKIIAHDYETYQPPEGNYNSYKDFKRLCAIDPDRVGTFAEFYDIIRALSHSGYKNAHLNDTYFKIQIL